VPKLGLVGQATAVVDPFNAKMVKNVLRTQPGVYHTITGGILIFGHNTGIFRDLSRMNIDDRFIYGNEVYVVDQRGVIEETNISILNISDGRLILVTCWPANASTQRYVVVAYRESALFAAQGK